MSRCRQVASLLDAFVDGELPTDRMLEVEEHLEGCQTCAEHLRVVEAMRLSVRRTVRADAVPSEGFRQRLEAALDAERERELGLVDENENKDDSGERQKVAAASPWAWPLAAAAVFTMASVSVLRGQNDSRDDAAAIRESKLATAASEPISIASTVEALLDELVQAHARPPAPQITEPTLVDDLEPEVGVPVRLPSLATYGARWEGGSVIPVRQMHRAALLRYRVSDHPVTVYVYDARRVPLRVVLETRVVRDVPVHVGAHRGYSIAAREHRGVGYAVATDLTGDESAELVAAIH